MGDLRGHFDCGQLRLIFYLRRLQLGETAEWRKPESWRFGAVAAAKLLDNREPGVPPRSGTVRCRRCPVTSPTSRSRSGAAPGWLIAAVLPKALGPAAAGGFRSEVRVAQPPDLVREGLR